jgi:hypothetical protein
MKTNWILFVVGLVLSIPCYFTLQAEEMTYRSRDSIPYLFPGFVPENVRVIQLQQRKSEEEIKAQNLQGTAQFEMLAFERSADGWLLANTEYQGLPVRSAMIDRNILDHVKEIRIDAETLVKQDATAEFLTSNQLTAETGIVVQCKLGRQGPDVATLVLGRSTKQGDQPGALDAFLVSRPDRPREVVLYEPKGKRWGLSLRSSDWLDKRIHQFTMSNVESFYFRNAFGSAGFTKKPGSDATWVAIQKQCSVKKVDAIRQQEVTNLIDRFTKVTADSYGRGKIEVDTVGAKMEIRVKLKTGEEYSVWVKAKSHNSNARMCVSSERKFLFAWGDIWVDAFGDKDPRDLFD